LAGVKAILSTHRANRGEDRNVIVTISTGRLVVASQPGDGAPATSVAVDLLDAEPVALESFLRQDAAPDCPEPMRVTLNPRLLARFAAAATGGQPVELAVAPDRMGEYGRKAAAVQVAVGKDFRGAIQPYSRLDPGSAWDGDGWGEGFRTLGKKRGAR
ncbi:MAG TPA: hypothetical protein PLY19_09490, partial [Rhodoglobus sp.]|nr:hypothetical protein [Rhodoglobus sp.]